MMTDTDLARLREQGPTAELPPLDKIARRAGEMKRRGRRHHLTAVAAVAVVLVAAVVAEPWSSRTQHGIAGADVLAAVGANSGCTGFAQRATPAQADSVRYLPGYVPAGFTIHDAFTNHFTDDPCFRFLARTVYARRAGPSSVAATLTISTGSEPVSRIDCGPGNPPAPTPVDAPSSDFQRCVTVRGHRGALVHILDTTSVAWIEPNVGAVSVNATALPPDVLLAFVNHLATPGGGKIVTSDDAVPLGYSIAYDNWDQFRELTVYDEFRGTFVQGSDAAHDFAELWVSVRPIRRPLWTLLPFASFDLIDINGHEGFLHSDEGGVGVNWKVGDTLFSVNVPPGVTPADALRVARSMAPVPRDDPRLIDP